MSLTLFSNTLARPGFVYNAQNIDHFGVGLRPRHPSSHTSSISPSSSVGVSDRQLPPSTLKMSSSTTGDQLLPLDASTSLRRGTVGVGESAVTACFGSLADGRPSPMTPTLGLRGEDTRPVHHRGGVMGSGDSVDIDDAGELRPTEDEAVPTVENVRLRWARCGTGVGQPHVGSRSRRESAVSAPTVLDALARIDGAFGCGCGRKVDGKSSVGEVMHSRGGSGHTKPLSSMMHPTKADACGPNSCLGNAWLASGTACLDTRTGMGTGGHCGTSSAIDWKNDARMRPWARTRWTYAPPWCKY